MHHGRQRCRKATADTRSPSPPGVVLRWWFELQDRHMRCFVKIDATALKDYALVDTDERTDIISFPVH